MAEKILKAEVATVNLGHLEFEGLLREDGEFAIAIQQIASLFPYFQDSQNQASQKLKRMMGKDFKTHKIKALNQRKYILAILLIDFEKVLRRLDKACDPTAEDISEQLIGVSLHQYFADAFGLKFEIEQRQQWLKERQESKAVRRQLVDALKDYVSRHSEELSENRKKYLYNNVTEKTYCALFGANSVKLKKVRNLSTEANIRDNFNESELFNLTHFEYHCAKLIDGKDLDPFKAVEIAKEQLC